jgi:hypothetical protein
LGWHYFEQRDFEVLNGTAGLESKSLNDA